MMALFIKIIGKILISTACTNETEREVGINPRQIWKKS